MSEVNTAASELGVQGIANFDIMNPTVFFGLIVGVAIPAVFSAMLMLGVDKKRSENGLLRFIVNGIQFRGLKKERKMPNRITTSV